MMHKTIVMVALYKQSNWEGTKYCRSVPSLDCHKYYIDGIFFLLVYTHAH